MKRVSPEIIVKNDVAYQVFELFRKVVVENPVYHNLKIENIETVLNIEPSFGECKQDEQDTMSY